MDNLNNNNPPISHRHSISSQSRDPQENSASVSSLFPLSTPPPSLQTLLTSDLSKKDENLDLSSPSALITQSSMPSSANIGSNSSAYSMRWKLRIGTFVVLLAFLFLRFYSFNLYSSYRVKPLGRLPKIRMPSSNQKSSTSYSNTESAVSGVATNTSTKAVDQTEIAQSIKQTDQKDEQPMRRLRIS
eukprot:gene7300-7874_t